MLMRFDEARWNEVTFEPSMMFPKESSFPSRFIGYLIVAGRSEQALSIMAPVQSEVALLVYHTIIVIRVPLVSDSAASNVKFTPKDDSAN